MNIRPLPILARAIAATLSVAVSISPVQAQNAGDAPDLTVRNFAHPPMTTRPIYRWWLPLAAVEDVQLRRELDDMWKNGAGGVEIAAMSVPGELGADPAFLAEYGFGTPRWSKALEVIYDQAYRRDFTVDMMVGPLWPTAMPNVSTLNDPAAQQQLVGGYVRVGPGESRQGPLPIPTRPGPTVATVSCAEATAGSNSLQVRSSRGLRPGDNLQIDGQGAKLASIDTPTSDQACHVLTVDTPLQQSISSGAPVVGEANRRLVSVLVAQCATDACPERGATRLLRLDSIRNVSDQVSSSGELSWTAPAEGPPWWVIAVYQTADGQRLENLSPTSPNYVVDHLSLAGAEAVTSFYDDQILTPRLKALIRRAGNSALFEDSFEPSDGLKWTTDFLPEFERRRGYDLTPYLPVLVGGGVGARRGFFEIAEIGERIREDYRQTFSDLYGDRHIRPYTAWANANGLKTRLQIEGGPMQIGELAALPDIPEGENRNFLNNPELWKIIGIGAQMREREPVFSTECCPVAGGVWATTAGGPPFTVAKGTGSPFGGAGNDSNLNWIYKAFMGGANQLVWHGYPYSVTPPGTGPRSTWPGNSMEGNTSFSEAFGDRMPQWPDYRLVNDHLARLQLVLRQGRPRYDVAVFWHDFGVKGLAPHVTAFTGYPGLSEMFETTSSLAGRGFTYQYISPNYLTDVSTGDTREGVWLPERLGFKAIVLNRQEVMPLESLKRLSDLSLRHAVPLVIVGVKPDRTPGLENHETVDRLVSELMTDLEHAALNPASKVRFVATEADLPTALNDLGVTPALSTGPTEPSTFLSLRRHAGKVDYYTIFNQGLETREETLTFAGEGQPYAMDTWTGLTSPIRQYDRVPGGVRVSIRLAANDIKVVAVGRLAGSEEALLHATTSTGEVVAKGRNLFLRADQPGVFTASLSDGRVKSIDVDSLDPVQSLGQWSLVMESWTPPPMNVPGVIETLKTTLPPVSLTSDDEGRLQSWSEAGYPNIAGIGHYSTTLTLPSTWSRDDGGWLDLGRVVDTYRLTVNGRALPPMSFQDTGRIDLGPYLHAGENVIQVRVATPLRNAVVTATGAEAKRLTDTGLLGPVRFTPYRDYPLGR